MNAVEVFEISSKALVITGRAEWDSSDVPGQRDALIYLDDDASEEGPLWCLAPTDAKDADYVAMDTAMARELIEAHLRGWLLRRAWQLQATMRKEKLRWRLVDCLSIADGGGDRLDHDYPYGDDEFSVLCESVAVVAPM